MNEIILTIILTLLIHSLIGTIIFIITKKDEEFAIFYAIGIIGWIIVGLYCIAKVFKRWLNYHNKRSIFEDENGERFYCKTKYTNDFIYYYEMVDRYATKDEWQDLKPFTKEQIKSVQRNCRRCKHHNSCDYNIWVRCEHDESGTVIEFDKFERR